MRTYGYSRTKSKGEQAKKVAIALVGVSLVAFCGVGGNTYFKHKKIDETVALIETLKEEQQALQTQIQGLEQTGKDLEKDARRIEQILWQFEPIIIPDSMK